MSLLALLLGLSVGARAQQGWSPSWATLPESLQFRREARPQEPPFDPDAAPEPDPPATADDEEGAPRRFATAPLSYSGARRLSPSEYPAFSDDLDAASLARAAEQSDRYWSALGDLTAVSIGGRRYTVGDLRASARALVRLARRGAVALQAEVPARFDVFESVAPEVVFTAYYEPQIDATLTPDAAHPMPIYERPRELLDDGGGDFSCRFLVKRRGRIRFAEKPCWTRAQIDRGALAGRHLELAWASAPDVFDLQLEGSGTLLIGGVRRKLGYDSANGRPFRSAERALRDGGGIPDGAEFFEFIRGLPTARQLDILEKNPRYTFFHDVPPDQDGPTGALGTPLTAGRSLAVSDQMPRGLPAFIDVAGIRRLAFAQDAGKAISDPGRADLFWGGGPRAGAEARRFKHPGRLFFLVLKQP